MSSSTQQPQELQQQQEHQTQQQQQQEHHRGNPEMETPSTSETLTQQEYQDGADGENQSPPRGAHPWQEPHQYHLECSESNYDSEDSLELDALHRIHQDHKNKWINAFTRNAVLHHWILEMPLYAFSAGVSELLRDLFIAGVPEYSNIYPLLVMWGDIQSEIEERIGDQNINFGDWLGFLEQVDAELFSRVVFSENDFNFLVNVMLCVLGVQIKQSIEYFKGGC